MDSSATDEYGIDGFAIVDFETTGLFADRSDRVVEVAVIRLDRNGSETGQFSSLINPRRDVGPTHIHGITATDVADAPTFSEIAGDVLDLVRNAAFVAHNAAFDRRFLRAEMSRIDVTLPDFPTLCTMRLVTKIGHSIPGRKLSVLCDHFGIACDQAHAAIDDARATTELFRICVKELGGWSSPDLWQYATHESTEQGRKPWPGVTPTGRSYCRTRAAADRTRHEPYLSRLVTRLAHTRSSDQGVGEYLALLDRVLEDRRVCDEELDQLLDVANERGISKEQAIEVHCEYMRSLMRAALEDGVITTTERDDLKDVQHLLGLTNAQAESIMTQETAALRQGDSPNGDTCRPDPELAGKSVCFTGALQCSVDGRRATRAMAWDAAEAAGMSVSKNVGRSLDYLVVADPETMSAKARKARDTGVRVLAEPVFWRKIGISVD